MIISKKIVFKAIIFFWFQLGQCSDKKIFIANKFNFEINSVNYNEKSHNRFNLKSIHKYVPIPLEQKYVLLFQRNMTLKNEEFYKKYPSEPLIKRKDVIDKRDIIWKDVIDKCKETNSKSFFNYLESLVKRDVKISSTNNYNPFNHILQKTNDINYIKDIVNLMVKLGADINQKEINYNIFPIYKQHLKDEYFYDYNQYIITNLNDPTDKHNQLYISSKDENLIDENLIKEAYKNLPNYNDNIKTIDVQESKIVYWICQHDYEKELEVFNIPIFNVLKIFKNKNSKDIIDLLNIFIENKANINLKNIILYPGSINYYVEKQELLIEAFKRYKINDKVSFEIIDFLCQKGLNFLYKKNKTIVINGIEFEVRYTNLFNFFISDIKDKIMCIEKFAKYNSIKPQNIQVLIQNNDSRPFLGVFLKNMGDQIIRNYIKHRNSIKHKINVDTKKKDSMVNLFNIPKYILKMVGEKYVEEEGESLNNIIKCSEKEIFQFFMRVYTNLRHVLFRLKK